jgi:hypothetical protein
MTPSLADAAKDFHLEEYKRLVGEIQSLRDSQNDFEKYALLAIAAFYAWFLSQPVQVLGHIPLPAYVGWIPAVISLIALSRALIARHGILRISRYLLRIEKTYSSASYDPTTQIPGWETTMWAARRGWRIWVPSAGPAVTWALVAPATVAIALLWKP